jgi:ABC-type polysaccharide/polyol phosphate export permease
LNLFFIIYGVSLILATLNIFFNDIHHAWEMILLLGFWTAGIFFDVNEYLEKFPILFSAHPFVGLIINMREVTMFGTLPNFELMLINMLTSILMIIVGNALFNKYEHLAIEKL